MANPRLLLLDEVSLGLAPIVIRQLYDALPAITATGTTILLVEQNIDQALGVAARVLLPAGGSHRPHRPARGPQPNADRHRLLRHLSMEWLNVIVQGVLLGGLYAMLATGLSLVFGVMRLVNLAQGDLTDPGRLPVTLAGPAHGHGPVADADRGRAGDDAAWAP